ncbi:MAG TPA: serine/threonine-protein kinase [Thermoguttaceae bacterium]|nr:serine/threonine-protein kinase [Thermoguttaceae bacterium]HPP53713.1 serine/threonine-protein kinase [Thermoguttaceae bacterium]
MSKASEAPGYIGPYRLLNVVNTSQTRQIWQAINDATGQFVGLKVLLEQYRKNREQLGLLRWEYKVGHRFDHPRVIRIFEYGTHRGLPYLAMEWFSAPNMKTRIRQGIDKIAPLLPKIILQATEAVAYFNQQGWIHRDIKPDNFLVNDQGEVKLIDFGLAQRRRGLLLRLFAPRSRQIQGTRSYMSPEQIRGEPVDERSDLYSLACTLFELAAGRPPFTGVTSNELLNKHLKAAPPLLDAVAKNATPEFAQLLKRAMAKRPKDRPRSVEEFLDELRIIKLFRQLPRPPELPAGKTAPGSS